MDRYRRGVSRSIAGVVFLMMPACGGLQQGASSSNPHDITGRMITLGEGYNDSIALHLQGTCLEFDPKKALFVPPKAGEFKVLMNMDSESILRKINGNAQANLNLSGFSGNASVDMATESSATRYRSNIMVSYTMSDGYYQFDFANPSNVKIQKSIFDIANPSSTLSSADREKICGTRFVSGMKLGASFVGIVSMEFKNESDKFHFDGKLAMSFPQFQAEGKLKLDNSTLSKSMSIKVHLIQKGGNATQLSSLFGTSAGTNCSGNEEGCMQLMGKVWQYASDAFPKQLAPGNENPGQPIGINWEKYFATEIEHVPYNQIEPRWDGKPPTQQMIETIGIARNLADSRFLEEKRAYNRADMVLKNDARLSPEDREELLRVQEKIMDRLSHVSEKAKSCYQETIKTDEDANKCMSQVKELAADLKTPGYFYDSSKFTIVPKNYSDWCVILKNWTEFKLADNSDDTNANLVLNPNDRDELFKMLNVGFSSYLANNGITFTFAPNEAKPESFPQEFSPLWAMKFRRPNAITYDFFRPYYPTENAQFVSDNKMGIRYLDCSSTSFPFDSVSRVSLIRRVGDLPIKYGNPLTLFQFARSLDLANNSLETLNVIPRLTTLQELKLDNISVTSSLTDLSLSPYTPLASTQVSRLHLTFNDIVGNGMKGRSNILEDVSDMRGLATLNLSDNELLTDLRPLKSKTLVEIALFDTGVTREAIRDLVVRSDADNGLPNLRVIYLDDGHEGCSVVPTRPNGATVKINCAGRAFVAERFGRRAEVANYRESLQ